MDFTGVDISGLADGSSNTLLLAHKAVRSDQYAGCSTTSGSCTDQGWFYMAQIHENKRNPTLPVGPDIASSSMSTRFGSAHSGAMPCAFADGSVRTLSYSIPTATWQLLWSYNDGTVLDPALMGQ